MSDSVVNIWEVKIDFVAIHIWFFSSGPNFSVLKWTFFLVLESTNEQRRNH